MNRLKRYLITGFIITIPVFLTIYIIFVAFRFFDGILGKYINLYLEESVGFYIPGLGLILFLLLFFLMGFLTRHLFGKNLFPLIEKWFASLPLINKIYPTMKQIVLFVLAQQEFGFKKVVLLEYPSKGIWSLGFLTNDQFKRVSEVTNREMVSVFVPTSPGPLTGYVVFVAREDLRFPDFSVSEALKIIISAGVFKV